MDGSSHHHRRRDADMFLANYKVGKNIGFGAFGKVKVAEHILTGHKVAIKILNRLEVKKNGTEAKVRREINIQRLLMHPHIIRLYEVIETPADIYLVMEYAKSGELFDYILQKEKLDEDEARKFFQQIISGVEYCHRNMVVHRDLKPENLLLDSNFNVKIADFGLSNTILRDGHLFKTSCGSPNYAAPEVVSGKSYAGPEVDVWSCGVILYALLCGTLPFPLEGANFPLLFKKIKAGIYSFPSHLTPGARDLIRRILVVDPMQRITIPEIRQHAWFQQAHLPRYLAAPDTVLQQAKRIAGEIVERVVKMGFDRNRLLDSLANKVENEGTVAYYLLLDNRFQETMNLDLDLNLDIQGTESPPVGRKWGLGLQSRSSATIECWLEKDKDGALVLLQQQHQVASASLVWGLEKDKDGALQLQLQQHQVGFTCLGMNPQLSILFTEGWFGSGM